MRTFVSLAALALIAAQSAPVGAADLPAIKAPPAPPVSPASDWRYELTGYGFLSSLNGEIGVGRLPSADVNVPFGQILSNLKGVASGSLVARNETYLLSLDGMWVRVAKDLNFRPDPGPLGGTRSNLSQDLVIVTAFGGYRLPFGSPNLSLYGTVGARLQAPTARFTLSAPVVGAERANQQSVAWVDPLIGLALRYRIDDKWFVDAVADIGGFGAGSQFTTQDQLTVGYNWTSALSTALGYRVLYTDYSRSNSNGGSFRYDTTLHGPYVGLTYNF